MRRVVIVLIVIILLAAVVVVVYRTGRNENKPAAVLEKIPERAVPVETAPVNSGDLFRATNLTVTFNPQSSVPIVPKAAGTIAEVHVAVGARVRKGDVLFVVDDRQYSLQKKQAEAARRAAAAGLGQAEIALANAREEYARAVELFERKMISRQQLDAAELQYESAKAAYEAAVEGEKQAEIALELAELQLEYTRVTAEISGTIAEFNVQKGGVCAQGSPAGSIIDNSRMKARVLVPETQVKLLKPGEVVTLTANAWPGRVFSGRILTVSPQADRQTRQFPVEIVVENSGGELKAGMLGSVSLVTAAEKNTLLLPIAAVLYDGSRTYVYIIENGRAARREVALGLEAGEQVAVSAGLAEGDLVITRGQHQVKEGTMVEVRK